MEIESVMQNVLPTPGRDQTSEESSSTFVRTVRQCIVPAQVARNMKGNYVESSGYDPVHFVLRVRHAPATAVTVALLDLAMALDNTINCV